ncbi:MAG: hypothetical protein KIS89_06520 [Dokdonella sp.]|nr:hypothetical protein [Dokdonella sp.]
MQPEAMPGARSARWPWWLLVAAAVLAGSFLRVWQLRSQMLMDDEWHAVRKLIGADMENIADHFGVADYSIPLTLYYRWLYQQGTLSEWSMHLPLLLCGLALLLLAPALLRRTLALPERATWTALLALSPLLIYLSRTARPYALLALCGVIALVALRNWYQREGRSLGWAGVYVLATCLAGWAHLLSLLFTLWPLACVGLVALAGCLRPARRAQSWALLGHVWRLGAFVAGVLAIALLPPLLNDWDALAGKAATDSVSWNSFYRTLLMAAGTFDGFVLAASLALGVLGGVRLWRRDRFLVVAIVGAGIVGVAAIALARPAWVQHPAVLARYCTPILPWLLLLVAAGLVALLGRLRNAAVAACAVAAWLAIVVVRGPLPTWYYDPNQFMGHALFQFDYDPRANPYVTLFELGPVSPFYRELAQRPPGSVTLIETPAHMHSNYVPDPWLQRIHRQNVKFALAAPVCGEGDWDEYSYHATGAHFSRVGRLGDIVEGATWGADYLVLRMQPWTLPYGAKFPWPVPWPDMAACAARVEARLGAPVHRDAQVTVFALRKDPR